MPIEADSDVAAIVIREFDERFHVRDESSASWVVRKIVEERAHRQRVSDWFERETLRSERRERFLMHRFGAELAEWTKQRLQKQHGKRRSVHLPAGVIGFRITPTKLIVADEPKLIAWCRAYLPTALQVVERALKSEIGAYIKESGEIPDGAEFGGGEERFYIK